MPTQQPINCIRCSVARFPKPSEQCYRWGGLVCTIDGANVGKHDPCRFGYVTENEAEAKKDEERNNSQ